MTNDRREQLGREYHEVIGRGIGRIRRCSNVFFLERHITSSQRTGQSGYQARYRDVLSEVFSDHCLMISLRGSLVCKMRGQAP